MAGFAIKKRKKPAMQRAADEKEAHRLSAVGRTCQSSRLFSLEQRSYSTCMTEATVWRP